LSFRAALKKWDIFSVLTRNPPLENPERESRNFSIPSPPVIPGSTEKMGHFFSADPESTA
ncbi:hypothetical protein QUF72_16940, partial [Desulfobacterales bacterium HSG2]|nr:hypothetical protein [Desulfobacterales bacterium HSG2]